MTRSEGQRQSQKQERRLASAMGGRTVGGSGNSWSHKGDIDGGEFLVEAKWTGKNSYSVTANVWRKIETEAARSAKVPVLAVRLDPSDLDLIVVSEADYLSLVAERDSLRAGGTP